MRAQLNSSTLFRLAGMEVELTHGNWWMAFVIAAVILAPMVYRVVRYRGLKGAAFRAPVLKKIGEIETRSRGLKKTKFRIHVLGSQHQSDGPDVGIEVIDSTFASSEMRCVSLTRSEARMLADELSQAADASERKEV
jgi:hypothetical protein